MGIGISIFLLALGAILTFAVNASITGLDLQVIGVILMASGLLGLVLFLAVFAPRTRRANAAEDAAGYRERDARDRDVY